MTDKYEISDKELDILKTLPAVELSEEGKDLLEKLKKPKYLIKYFEDYMIIKGLNPYAPWMKEDHERCKKILENK